MKISLIATVLNEEKSIRGFLTSVIRQTRRPDEFVIVDGGSEDSTFEILKNYSKKYKWIRVYQLEKATIGKGRNYAIEKSKNHVIAVTDGGCIVDKKWLESISKEFEKNGEKYDVISGVYECGGKTIFQKSVAVVVGLDNSRLPDDIEPSSRSALFKKSFWRKVKGYPDSSVTDDTIFNIKLKLEGAKFQIARNAMVYWPMRENLHAFAKQFFRYGYGDGTFRIPFLIAKMPNNKDAKGSFLSIAYVSLIFLLLAISYYYAILIPLVPIVFLIDFIKKISHKKIENRKVTLLSFVLLIVKRFSYFFGFAAGLLNSFKTKSFIVTKS